MGLSRVLANTFGYIQARNSIYAKMLDLHTDDIVDNPKFKLARSVYLEMLMKAKKLGSQMVVVRICPSFISTKQLQEQFLAATKRRQADYNFLALDQALDNLFSSNGARYYVFKPRNCSEQKLLFQV